jgi:hypothetical protein
VREHYHALLVGDEAASDLGRPASTRTEAGAGALWSWLDGIVDPPVADGVAPDRALLGYAPLALVDGCWLAPWVDVRRSYDALGAACLDALYLASGEGDAARHRANRFRGVLAARGLAVADPATRGFADDARLADDDFALAIPALELARSNDAAPECLGFHAAARALGAPAFVMRERDDREVDAARRCLDAFDGDWSRVRAGAEAFVAARHAWIASLRPAETVSPWQAMIDLVASKARRAQGYHRRIDLGGKSIDEWLDPAGLDGVGFLDALAASRFVVPGKSAESELTTRSVAFGGPMFGVFDDRELAVVRAWIDALPEKRPEAAKPAARAIVSSPRTSQTLASLGPQPLASLGLGLGVYHHLLNRLPGADAVARAHVARAIPRVTERQLAARGLWPWSPDRLAAWVDTQLDAEIVRDDDLGLASRLSRDDVVWLLTQLAPAALIDGAWLQGTASPSCLHTPAASLLFQIYRDELGAGVPRQHHGNVMRDVLAAQGVALPPCDSRAFVEHPSLLPQSFSTPALWLAVATRTPSMIPELLGLNLAIEMAGIGRTYAKAIAMCRRHAIDPYFFELHNTIDNAASGHTAWSTRAIDLYLDGLGDDRAVDAAWLRIWQGHAAYAASSKPLVRAIALRVGPRLAWRWLTRRSG